MFRVVASNLVRRYDFISEHITLEEAELFIKEQIDRRIWGLPERWLDSDNILELEKPRIQNERVIAGAKVQYFLPADYTYKVEKIVENVEINYWETLRYKRNKRLLETDYTQLADCPYSSEIKKKYRGYRKYLRDITNNYNQETISKFAIMSFERWDEWNQKK